MAGAGKMPGFTGAGGRSAGIVSAFVDFTWRGEGFHGKTPDGAPPCAARNRLNYPGAGK